MVLAKLKPFTRVDNFSGFLDGCPSLEEHKAINGLAPKMHIKEDKSSYCIDADLSGVKKEDIKIDIQEKKLIISCERKHKNNMKQEDCYRLEAPFGKFERVFSLPAYIDIENITANNANGILEMVIPKEDKYITKKKNSNKINTKNN